MGTKNTSFVLGDKYTQYTRKKVESGEYASTSEVIRDALRLHEERAIFRSKILEKIDQGLASPIDDNFDIDSWFTDEFIEA